MSLLTISPQYEIFIFIIIMLHIRLLDRSASARYPDCIMIGPAQLHNSDRLTDYITLTFNRTACSTTLMTTRDSTKCLINRRSETNKHFKQLKRSLGQKVQCNDIILGLSYISQMMVHRPEHVAVRNRLVPPSDFTSDLLFQSYLCANMWI